MKIYRRGHYKNKGSALLLDRAIKRDQSKYRWRTPRWDGDTKELIVSLKGVEDQTTHDYEFRFTAEDLGALIETAVADTAKTPHEVALAPAISAFLSSLLELNHETDPTDS